MKLYLDDVEEKGMFKLAAFAARVSEAPENWPQELTSEILRQLPYLSDYDLNVNLQTVDPQRGFAFGYGDLASKTERPEVEHQESGIPHIRIPLVIQDRAVRPFNVFLDGERVVPLTEERIRQTLFNPQSFDLSSSPPRDPSLVESLMPPTRTGPGMGGEYKMASVTKEATMAGFLAKNSPHMMESAMRGAHAKGGLQASQALAGKAMATDPASRVAKGAGKMQSRLNFMHGDTPMPSMAGHAAPSPATGAAIGPQTKVGPGAVGPEGTKVLNQSQFTAMPATNAARPSQISQPVQSPQPAQQSASTGGRRFTLRKSASILSEIAHTIRRLDADAFVEKIASDPTLIAGFRRSGCASELVSIFDNIQNQTSAGALYKVASSITPTVATFLKLPGGDFLVKTAATGAFAGGPQAQGQVVPQEEAAEAIGPQNAQAMQPGQSATAVSNPVPQTPPVEMNDKVVDEFGQWLVQDQMGNKLTGWVFPQTLAWDGNFTPQPIALFTNGSAYAFQEQIAGELAGKSTTLPSDPPRGDGVFYCTKGGKAIATQPVMIGSAMAGPDGLPKFIGTDAFGQQVQISLSEGLKEPTRVGDVEYALPEDWKFMRLNNQTQLASDPTQMNKAASVRAEASSVEVLFNGSYHLRGGCGLDKVASEFRRDLDPIGAEFILGVLGVDGILAKTKIAEARKKGIVKLSGLHTITTLEERYSSKVKEASALLSRCPDLRVDLIKEAASVDDASTVNNVLSLNFINPENLHMFINYIPELEQTSEKLAEMWLYAVMGMNELPEDHLERAMKNMEHVIEGLKGVAHAES